MLCSIDPPLELSPLVCWLFNFTVQGYAIQIRLWIPDCLGYFSSSASTELQVVSAIFLLINIVGHGVIGLISDLLRPSRRDDWFLNIRAAWWCFTLLWGFSVAIRTGYHLCVWLGSFLYLKVTLELR